MGDGPGESMRRLAQSVAAVVFGALIVTASVIGGVMMTNPTVHTVEDASNQIVQRGEGQVLIAAGTAVAIAALGKAVYDHHKNEVNTENLRQTDALETKKEIYDQASIQGQNNQILATAYGNYLNDTETIALMEGKNAYIRALENGSAESVARNRAIDAVADYYSVKQQNVIASWNTSVYVANSSHYTAQNTSGIDSTYVSGVGAYDTNGNYSVDSSRYVSNFDMAPHSVTLVNASTEGVATVEMSTESGIWTPQNFSFQGQTWEGDKPAWYVHNVTVEPPDSNYDQLELLDATQTRQKFAEIEQQNDVVQAQLDTFINNTYENYQQGEINSSDLVDPYLGAREYSPENSSQFQDWSLRSLSALGLNSPQNLSNIGRMEVTTGGMTYEGILMSDGNPTGGFTVGDTYDAQNLTGSQFVALADGGAKELTGKFTLANAETSDGTVIEENESVTYNNITYETANTSEFKALQDELDGLTAEINAKQQQQRNAGGGGLLPDFGFGGVGAPVGLIAAGAVVFLLGRN